MLDQRNLQAEWRTVLVTGSEEIGQERIVIMEKLSKAVSFAHVVREGDCSVFGVLGANVELLLGPQADDEALYLNLTSRLLTSIYMDKEEQFT